MRKYDISQEGVQAMRQVYLNGPTGAATASEVVHIESHLDDAAGKEIVLWGDILMAFQHARHVRHGSKVLALLKGPGYKTLDPPRIAAVPHAVLDVYVEADSRTIMEAPMVKAQSVIPILTYSKWNPHHKPTKAATSRTLASNKRTSAAIFRDLQPGSTNDAPQLSHLYIDDNTKTAIMDNWGCAAANNELQAAAVTHRARASHNAHQDGDQQQQQRCSIDYEGAVDWFIGAASQGDMSAQFKLGMFYDHGLGVKQDYIKAMAWYLKAADQGSAEAQSSVGNIYFLGLGVKQDYAKAMEWFLRAANQGDPGAQSKVLHLSKQWRK